jgi:hypothetical protein
MPDLIELAKDPRTQFAAIALIAGALGSALVEIASDDPERDDKLATLGEALKGEDPPTQAATVDTLDTATVHAEIQKLRADCPQCMDVGGGLVEPGAEYEAGVMMPLGTSLVALAADDCPGRLVGGDLVCILDPGSWNVTVGSCSPRNDGSWCYVTATSTGDKAQRFLALVKAGP